MFIKEGKIKQVTTWKLKYTYTFMSLSSMHGINISNLVRGGSEKFSSH